MSRIRCFMITPAGRARLSLRRYGGDGCGSRGYHNAEQPLFEVDEELSVRDGFDRPTFHHHGPQSPEDVPAGHEWPMKCDDCDYVFAVTDASQVFSRTLYRRSDNGELTTLDAAPAGAMWFLTWMQGLFNPQLGDSPLCVMTPGGEWIIDSRASNCTMPDDYNQERHHCWIAHGTPPDITVDKAGVTCGAGAGSIQCGNYHGFLRNGYLED